MYNNEATFYILIKKNNGRSSYKPLLYAKCEYTRQMANVRQTLTRYKILDIVFDSDLTLLHLK